MNYSFFADIVADMLKMEPCRIKSVDKLNTDTQMASCDIKKRIVYVKRNIAVPDALFAISHEMRHIWLYRLVGCRKRKDKRTSKNDKEPRFITVALFFISESYQVRHCANFRLF